MTDKPKTIQEALAEVQRNVNEAVSPPFERDSSGGFRKKPQLDTSKPGGPIPDIKLAPETSTPKATPKSSTPKEPFFTPGKGIKSIAKNIVAPAAIGAGFGAAASQGAKELATGTETGRAVGKWVGKLPGAQPAAQAMVSGREKVADYLGKVPGVGDSLKAGYQNLYKDSKFNTASSTSGDNTPKPTPAPATTAVTKTDTNKSNETKPAAATDKPVALDKNKYAIYQKDSSSAKSFRDTFAAQKAAGASEFKWKGGDNVERSYSTKSAPEPKTSTSNTTSTNSDTLKPVDTSTMGPTKLTGPEDQGPSNARWYGNPNNKPGNPEESESGGKKKKMSEEKNPLIAAFLKLQETKAANMFEAAKKAKKDYDGDGDVESPKDEVWGSRFKAAKAAGKMEEENLDEVSKELLKKYVPKAQHDARIAQYQNDEKRDRKRIEGITLAKAKIRGPKVAATEGTMMDPKDPSVQGGSDVSSTPEKPAKAPKKVDGDPSYQGSGEVTMGGKPVRVKEETQVDELWEPARKGEKGSSARKRKAVQMRLGKNNQDHPDWNPRTNKQHSALVLGRKLQKQGMTEEETVEFSQAEIDHINSFFEQVAPSRPEPTKGVNPSVKNIDLTDETLEEGRPKKNPQPETTERDARQHIQVIAGRAAAGNTLDFPHNDGSKSKITPAMGRKITSHLQGLKPAERQAAVNKMHASSEGLKI
jgi:hypothetical protein